MGKKQHQKDKLYLTTTEWKNEYGGYKGTSKSGDTSRFRRLPFHCCSISLQPFENPLCTKEGVVFDLMNIVPFLKKYGVSPVNGQKMSAKELIKLNFHKNADDLKTCLTDLEMTKRVSSHVTAKKDGQIIVCHGKYHCPVTFKVFNENTHIVAVAVTGNVYSNDAVERLNLKPGYLKDLLTDEPFTRKDIITIQDPTNLVKFDMSSFYHLKNNLKLNDEDEEKAKKDPRHNLKALNAETRDVLDELDREYKAPEKKVEDKKAADKFNAAHYSTGKVAASFTSTAMDPTTQHEAAIIDEDIIRYERVKKKGYIRMLTNFGVLNLELHCEMVPKPCENFFKHCISGYYRDTVFHRLIRNFMIQGGDPTGTGKGGESAWGGSFKDHFKPNLTHSGRGILSMANSGPDTNKSQFFITFRSANHLDGKHTVFGKVVGGLDTLDKMEKVETNKHDKPKEEIKIEDTIVFVNPFEEADEELKKERVNEVTKLAAEAEAERKKNARKEKEEIKPKTFKTGIGKYINPNVVPKHSLDDQPSETAKKKQKISHVKFGDFSSW